jgi:hypothetical protein
MKHFKLKYRIFIVGILSLSGAAFASNAAESNSTGVYSIENLREVSQIQNLDSRIELERVLEAKHNAQASYLALAPRLTFNSLATILSGGGVGLIGVIGDLVPFLFPSNWYQAKGNQIQAEAENITHQIAKLNVATEVESLANVIIRDENIIQHYRALTGEAINLRQEVHVRELMGQYPAGATNNIDSILYGLQQDCLTLQNNLKDQYVQLAVMAGLPSLHAITKVFWKKESSDLNHPWHGNLEDLKKNVLSRSLEIQQMDKMNQLAQSNVKKSYWSWLDPSGNYLTGLGLPFGENVLIAKDQLEQIRLQKLQVAQLAVQYAERSYNSYQDAIAHNLINTEGTKVQESRKSLLMDRISLGSKVDFYGLVQKENYAAQFRNMRAQLNRQLVGGFL